MYLTHKQMPGAIRKAKKVIMYAPIGANTSLNVMVVKQDILATFKEIAKNTNWPEVFNCSVLGNGWLYINGTTETRYL